ncbi:SdpI family protein [Candidatus Gracilibacteria bacterium]|nr:SdpI family protein [Candidatus Gracilibacteria bacterium]
MKKLLFIKLAVVLGMIIVGVIAYTRLPDIVPIHWGIDGYPDRSGSKLIPTLLFPIIALLFVILSPLFSRLDPKKDNYKKFANIWEIVQFSILGLFAYLYIIILYVLFNPELNIGTYIITGIGILFIILGNYLGKIRQNYFVGIRLPWTIANEEVWNKTHRFGGKIFMIGGIVLLLSSYFQFYPFVILLIVISMIVFVPIRYSYTIYKNIEGK